MSRETKQRGSLQLLFSCKVRTATFAAESLRVRALSSFRMVPGRSLSAPCPLLLLLLLGVSGSANGRSVARAQALKQQQLRVIVLLPFIQCYKCTHNPYTRALTKNPGPCMCAIASDREIINCVRGACSAVHRDISTASRQSYVAAFVETQAALGSNGPPSTPIM